jgi:TonB-linked SusC/RagA family outer membrane protein
MRLKALLVTACLLVSAAGWAQKVTLNEQNAPLKKIFKEIKKQTGYTFFYNAGLLDKSHPVSITCKDEDLKKVLDQCFGDQPLIYHIVNQTVVVNPRTLQVQPVPGITIDSVPAKVFNVEGRITDESGKPVAGASIVIKVKGSPGRSSEKDGNFNLFIPRGATLLISNVGYLPQEIKPKEGVFLDVKLVAGAKDPLANMVVTGYQVINKESFTGNAITVSGDDLKKVNPQNVLQSLEVFDPSFHIAQNNIAGSNPNVLPSINVRGSTALPSTAGSGAVLSRTDLSSNVNLPTFIMDGYEVSLEKVFDLDINRIQSVTLLKDAAATAVYGSRAANGVMVITTKAPREGKLQLYYNYELTPSTPDLTAYHVLNASKKLQYEQLAGLYNANDGVSQDQQDQTYYTKKLAVLSGINTDWLAQPVRTAIGEKHSLYLEGGTPAVRYGLNLLYQNSPGVMKGSSRDRYGIGVDLSYNPGSGLIFRNEITVNQVNSMESPWGNFSDYVRMNPYYPKTDSTGHILQSVDQWTYLYNLSGGGTAYLPSDVLNPMYNSTLHGFNKTAYLEFIDAFSAEWNISRGLRLRTVLSYTKKNTTNDDFVSPLDNQFYNYSTAQLPQRGSYTYAADNENTFDGSLTLTFNRQIGNQFFNLALGSNVRTYSTDSKSFEASGFSNDRFTNIGFANNYTPGTTPGGDFAKQRLFGSFLSLNYSWLNKYLLDVSVRADGSSQFGSNNRVAPFWAAGLGWNIHKEKFLQNSVISQLRIRTSTGLTGSVSFPPYLSETMYNYYNSNWYSTGVGAAVSAFGNSSLQWQRTQNYDVGMDIGLFKDKIVISPRYYYKLTHGLLTDIQLPTSTGFSSYTDNLGDMANKGVELNLKYTIISNRNWMVSVFANLVNNTNKIVKISDALKNLNDKADAAQTGDSLGSTPLLRYKEGQTLNEIYAVRSLGIDPETGREIYIKKDGTHTFTWNVQDVVPVADPTPKVMGSFGTSIYYKGFQLNTILTTRFGGKDYNQTLVDRVDDADPRYNVDSRALSNRWQKPGDHAQFKNIADQGTTFISSRFIEKDNDLDLTSVYLSYDFKKAFCTRLAMSSLRVALTVNDALHWSSMGIERGIDYPYARSFTFSIQTSF